MSKTVAILTTALAFIFTFMVILSSATPSYATLTLVLVIVGGGFTVFGYVAATLLARMRA